MPDLAELIGELLGPQDDLGVTDIVLTKVTRGTRTPGNVAGGTNPTTVDYTGRGFVSGEGRFMDGTHVAQDNVLISVFGATVEGGAKPLTGDRITIGGVTYKLGRVVFDQVGAVYEAEGQAP